MTDTQRVLEEFDELFNNSLIESVIETDMTDEETWFVMRKGIKKFLAAKIQEAVAEERELKTVYQCSCCGFRSDGILRIHDCEWTNQLKIGYLTKKD